MKSTKELAANCGQIKVNLSVREYQIEAASNKVRKLKYPGLSRILATLERTGATVLRTYRKGSVTIIDYTT